MSNPHEEWLGFVANTEQTYGNQRTATALRYVLAELTHLREDKARLDWCEEMAARHPELAKHGLVPMTRKQIDAARAEDRNG